MDDQRGPGYRERVYPQVDCVGCQVWIWELTAATVEGTGVVARRVHRDRPAGGKVRGQRAEARA